ncbi:hypothetical protein [Protaetiibacter intestinalis]|uniref:LppX_LprAFG lipoprotein n=1 Tax=Protaetiibacter intestinalis TaxID=2419774 RepID=A0A387B749_9MICO|nr:hypothetical protein [Protaetiibacter intestinalis]AYF97568.1 hypothetical protein D7I47_04360 [Protaetiibacter intestinalis]
MKARSVVVGGLAVVLMLVLAACGSTDEQPEDGPRAVTSEEAQLLAVTRFRNFDAGSRAFSTSISVSGVATELTGWVDWEAALGYATASGSFDAEALLWSDATVGAILTTPDADGFPAMPIPDTDEAGWQFQELDPEASPLFALLATISALGQDRPDNPLLVQQSGALRLRSGVIDGTAVTVFAAPPTDEPLEATASADPDASPLRLWVDGDGLLRRAEVHLNASWTAVDFGADGPRLALPEGGS